MVVISLYTHEYVCFYSIILLYVTINHAIKAKLIYVIIILQYSSILQSDISQHNILLFFLLIKQLWFMAKHHHDENVLVLREQTRVIRTLL